MAKIITSVIITTYEAPKSLALCLAGYGRQSVKDFELIVADDGSGSATKEVIDKFRKTCDFEVKHIWQGNKGYGVTTIQNKAVSASRGDLLIFSHGDCIPQVDFVKSHIDNFAPKSFRCGARVDMDLNFCRTLTQEAAANGDFESYLGNFKRLRYEWVHLESIFYIAVKKRNRPKVFGSNISVDREALFDMNGFDEDFIDTGAEDDDIRNRFIMYGAKIISLWNKAFVFHIDHAFDESRMLKQVPRNREKEIGIRHRALKSARCENGLVKGNIQALK